MKSTILILINQLKNLWTFINLYWNPEATDSKSHKRKLLFTNVYFKLQRAGRTQILCGVVAWKYGFKANLTYK